jgi:hypothetical protein
MAKMRWRLVVGLFSLGAALILTLPAAARPISRLLPVSWPAGGGVVADVIWPNGAPIDVIIWPNGAPIDVIIWPNPVVVGDASGGSAGT